MDLGRVRDPTVMGPSRRWRQCQGHGEQAHCAPAEAGTWLFVRRRHALVSDRHPAARAWGEIAVFPSCFWMTSKPIV